MDMDSWRSAIRSRLQDLAQRIREFAPGMTYGALSAATLLPVVAAANQGDYGALVALTGVVGGIGGNLIANQIQAWKDRSEQDLAADLTEKAQADPQWREALDTLLREMEAPRVMQAILSVADKDWFVDTLRGELKQIGSSLTLDIDNSGLLVIGTSNVVAAGDMVDNVVVSGSGNVVRVFRAEKGSQLNVFQLTDEELAVDRESALGQYLQHTIGRNRYLQLQGIRPGGKLVHIELDRIYVRLRTTQQHLLQDDGGWLAEQAGLAPGEEYRLQARSGIAADSSTVRVEEALSKHRRVVVLGDPGSGKTTLLRYLALLYAWDLAGKDSRRVQTELGLAESGYLPIFLPFRQIGSYLKTLPDDGTEGNNVLLDFFRRSLAADRIRVPETFFDHWLYEGKAVVLLDGLDEVPDPDLRRRVARLVEGFVRAYPDCRYVVTSRIVGYSGAARLGEQFATTTVRDFNMADIEQFLSAWHLMLAAGEFGGGQQATEYARIQTDKLLQAIQGNERIRELAINPLMLTVIAMVHRDRVELPNRRAELYAEAVDVLLGKWDEGKGVKDEPVLDDKSFDTGDKRLILQSVALHMHERQLKELEIGDLSVLLRQVFFDIIHDVRKAEQAVDRFLWLIQERAGMLAARGEGVFAFTHLTFQEYLAALAVAAQDDYLEYILKRVPEAWWREVILLEAGYLSTQSKERTTKLIRSIATLTQEPEPYHNLVLATECMRDVGGNRVAGNLEGELEQRLRRNIQTPPTFMDRWFRGVGAKGWLERRGQATEAWVRAGGGYWNKPYGEPEWVFVPAGEFWIGEESVAHRLFLPAFRIAKTPVTNQQYHLFTQATGHETPGYWEDGRPPRDLESHPVVDVSWRDAGAYCDWLTSVTGRRIVLPSEAEWEKAARGDKDKRIYPWGDELDLRRTTPVGIFGEGASPYGCLDMSGNVWEWTRSKDADYPYKPNDGRESAAGADPRVVRGGSFGCDEYFVRCAYRDGNLPGLRSYNFGFRVVSPGF